MHIFFFKGMTFCSTFNLPQGESDNLKQRLMKVFERCREEPDGLCVHVQFTDTFITDKWRAEEGGGEDERKREERRPLALFEVQ